MKASILSLTAIFMTALLFSCDAPKEKDGEQIMFDGGPTYSDHYVYTNSLDAPITITTDHQYEERSIYGVVTTTVTKTRIIPAGQSIEEWRSYTIGFGGSSEPEHTIYFSRHIKLIFGDGKEIEFDSIESESAGKDGINIYQKESYVTNIRRETDKNVDTEYKYDLGGKLYDLAR